MREVGRDTEKERRGQTEFPAYLNVALLPVPEPCGVNAQRNDADLLGRNAELGRDLLAGALRVGDDPLDRLHAQAARAAVMVVLQVGGEHRGDLVADQVLVGDDDVSRRFKEQLELSRRDHLGGLVNDLDVVTPLVRRDDPSFQSIGLSRFSHQERQLDIGESRPDTVPN